MDFKVGEMVRVKEGLPCGAHYINKATGNRTMNFHLEMKRYCGKLAVIHRVDSLSYGKEYRLLTQERERMDWIWTNEFLEPVEVKQNSQAKRLLDKEY